MRILCRLGIHKWETVRLVAQPYEYSVAYFDGDVCACCGQGKRRHLMAAWSTVVMFQKENARHRTNYPIVLHEAMREKR